MHWVPYYKCKTSLDVLLLWQVTGENTVLRGPTPVRVASGNFPAASVVAALTGRVSRTRLCILYSGCVTKNALDEWPWKQSPNESPGTRSGSSEFSAPLPAGLPITFFFNSISITCKTFLEIWKIRCLETMIFWGYFCIWEYGFLFFSLSVSNGTEGNVNPFCLLLCFCSWLLNNMSRYAYGSGRSLVPVSGYYKVRRKGNNLKALVLRG